MNLYYGFIAKYYAVPLLMQVHGLLYLNRLTKYIFIVRLGLNRIDLASKFALIILIISSFYLKFSDLIDFYSSFTTFCGS